MKQEYTFHEDVNNPRYLIIQNFMGGTLKLPMTTKTEYPEQLFRAFMNELYMIKGVQEVFESYGAKFYTRSEPEE